MTAPIEFYFEFSSPYGYFASTQVEKLAAEFGRSVNWHPILLGPMFKAMGSQPLTDIPLKGDYARRDFARTAALFDIPYDHPDPFPIATVSAARAVLYVRQHDQQKSVELTKRLYAAYFSEQQNISGTDVVLAIADSIGLNVQDLAEGLGQDSTKAMLRDEVDTAMQRGVFGSPFLIVDGEPFWGFDRFDHIRRWLAR
ncbi:MAG: 2-hydroxychromene-2-carboxylate isomerase [Candidimonas sp.]|nr:2-hydroxychromene-2-carboxylate isomerase [Candidimonas sp.]